MGAVDGPVVDGPAPDVPVLDSVVSDLPIERGEAVEIRVEDVAAVIEEPSPDLTPEPSEPTADPVEAVLEPQAGAETVAEPAQEVPADPAPVEVPAEPGLLQRMGNAVLGVFQSPEGGA